jgi:hypothetical protein
MRLHFFSHAALVAVLAMAACSPPRSALVNMWVDTGHEPEPMGDLLVVALWEDRDSRSLWEERFREELERADADVTVSYPGLSSPMPDSAAVFTEASRRNCDGVIVIHAHVRDRDTFYIPGYTMPQTGKQPRWYSFKRGSSGGFGSSAVRCDVELWSRHGSDMVWSGTAEVIDAGDEDHAAYKIADTVIRELSRLGLVPPRL